MKKMRRRRGFIPVAILHLLKEEAMHGYQIMKELEGRSGGAYSASAGSIYPALQELLEKELIDLDESTDRKVYSINDNGERTLQYGKRPGKDFWEKWKREMTWRNSKEAVDLHKSLDRYDKEFRKALKKVQANPKLADQLISLIDDIADRLHKNNNQ